MVHPRPRRPTRKHRRQPSSYYVRSELLLVGCLSVVVMVPFVWLLWMHPRLQTPQTNNRPMIRYRSDWVHLDHTSTKNGATPRESWKKKKKHSNNNNNNTTRRYLIFRPPLETAQGIGNLMQGLLATHALGKEFDRIVCVSNEWADFHMAWQVVNPLVCPDDNVLNSSPRTQRNTLWMINFGKLPVNECQLRDKLQEGIGRDESAYDIMYLVANTYPRWPTTKHGASKPIQLLDFYRPRPMLLAKLPWKQEPPLTVVHLRQPDDVGVDPREGLDARTLDALGQTLPSNTFLVTNQVDFYKYTETNFGWSHPPWEGIIQHSANSKVFWGHSSPSSINTVMSQNQQRQQQLLEMWSDWWALHQAEQVYHTHSDFSASAIHWSGNHDNKESYTIRGVDDEGNLRLEPSTFGLIQSSDHDEPFTIVLPLSQRETLQHCDLYPSGLDGLGYVLDLDDEFHEELQDDWKERQPRW